MQVENVAIRFGGVQALTDVSFSIGKGELVGLIGPNGAGKTTLLKIIAGVLKPDTGRVLIDGEDVTRLATAARVKKGLAITHQIVRPFRSMSSARQCRACRRAQVDVQSARRLVSSSARKPEDDRARVRSLLASALPAPRTRR